MDVSVDVNYREWGVQRKLLGGKSSGHRKDKVHIHWQSRFCISCPKLLEAKFKLSVYRWEKS